MKVRVKLNEIIEGMECQSDESGSFLNTKTGEVVFMTDYALRAAEEGEPLEDLPDWEQELVATAKEIVAETGEYISLPSKFDIDEYSIMESFCLSLDNSELRDSLCGLIKGSGAFRRFKDALYHSGIEKDWYSFRDNTLKEIAIDWCQKNNIEFDE